MISSDRKHQMNCINERQEGLTEILEVTNNVARNTCKCISDKLLYQCTVRIRYIIYKCVV